MTEMQRQFEEWAAKKGHKMERAPEPWFYEWASTACAWRAWQEAWTVSRAEIVVKLPSFFSDRYESEICFTDEVEKSLNEAGVSYE